MLSQGVFFQGLGMGASLIMPIGAQNAHVIRTAVRGRHVALTVAVCVAVDALLIALGASGVGLLVASSPRLLLGARYGGAAFLLWYGVRCLASAWRGAQAQHRQTQQTGQGSEAVAGGARQALFAVLALSLLNPHVYLDTVVLLGAVGRGLADEHQASFAAGAMTASLLWFSALGLVARRCAFVLGKPAVWRGVEAFTGMLMLFLAAALVRGA
jgi:L-lysine exporter family protein LysE/ArgO